MLSGKKFRELRKEKNLTKEQLASKIGVDAYKIEEWEDGRSEPDPDNLIILTTVLDCNLSDLFDDEDNEPKKTAYQAYKRFPYPILVVLIYLLMGFMKELWHPGWIIFLTIPLYYTLDAFFIPEKSKSTFCYPVLATIIYLILGFCFDLWHPGWLIFFTVPLYYGVVR